MPTKGKTATESGDSLPPDAWLVTWEPDLDLFLLQLSLSHQECFEIFHKLLPDSGSPPLAVNKPPAGFC